ncbi:hypothetical protein [Lacrimispora sp.]|uniref:hypothetical protein n=1 Tax=Lacrimispora sp. TaxID=2719234 RepID=UPI002FDAD5F1
MQNYMWLENGYLQTSYGVFAGVDAISTYTGGEVESLRLSERNVIMTEIGELIPAYTENSRRKNKASVEFDRHGLVTGVVLEKMQEVKTPIGELPAERVKFYSTGELYRLFILDGQISGFWSETDERELNIPLSFHLGFTSFQAMLNGICFYREGGIRSITLFPGERITVATPLGEVATGVGLSLYESGALRSVEPAEAVLVETPLGQLAAYDPDQNGLNADSNSLIFTEDGKIGGLITCDNLIHVQTEEGVMETFMPKVKTHPLYDDTFTVSGLRLEFDYEKNTVIIDDRPFSLSECGFTAAPFVRPGMHCTPADCASCSICNKG